MLNKSTLFQILFEIVDYLNEHGNEQLTISVVPTYVEKRHIIKDRRRFNKTRGPFVIERGKPF